MDGKTRAVADTSSLVSLELAGALEASFSIVDWVIPKAVVAELEELGEFDDNVGLAAKRARELIRNKRPVIKAVEPQKPIPSQVGLGEAAAFSLCLKEGIPLFVCDDVKAGYRLDGLARVHGVRIVIGAAVIVELVKRGIWTKEKAREAIAKMVDKRDWKGGVLEYLSKQYLNGE